MTLYVRLYALASWDDSLIKGGFMGSIELSSKQNIIVDTLGQERRKYHNKHKLPGKKEMKGAIKYIS